MFLDNSNCRFTSLISTMLLTNFCFSSSVKLKVLKDGMGEGREKEGVFLSLVAVASHEKPDKGIILGFAGVMP